MTTHAEKLKRWREVGGEAYALERLEKMRDGQRKASQKFYAKNAGKVIEWVKRYQQERNPEGFTAYNKAYKHDNYQNIRNQHLTQQERAAGRPRPMLCEICGQPDQAGRKLHYDHCHTHGHFRGWLCGKCNAGLGFARDDPEILMRMAVYLQMDRDKNWPKD